MDEEAEKIRIRKWIASIPKSLQGYNEELIKSGKLTENEIDHRTLLMGKKSLDKYSEWVPISEKKEILEEQKNICQFLIEICTYNMENTILEREIEE